MQALSKWTAQMVASAYRIRLYANNITPGYGTLVTNLVEADFDGYGSQVVLAWAEPIPVGDGIHVQAQAPTYTWMTSSSSRVNSIYGYYITDGDGKLVVAERDPAAPVTIGTAAGQVYRVTPNLSLANE